MTIANRTTMTQAPAPGAPPLTGAALRDRMLRIEWNTHLMRSATGVPRLRPEVVAELGRRVTLVDVRNDEGLLGPLGHIPGVTPVALADLAAVRAVTPDDEPIICVCADGRQSDVAVRYLEALGMTHVAAMEGGMARWKELGYATSRDPQIVARRRDGLTPCEPEPEPGDGPIDLDALRSHLGDVGAVRWIKLAAFLLHGKHACVDGRDDHGVVGTPGGSAGEFVLALTAWERVVGMELDGAQVQALLASYIDTFGRFYLHTDTAASAAFFASMRQDPRLAETVPRLHRAEDWRVYLSAPPVELREALLEHFVEPHAIGCGHVKRMLTLPDVYGVRAELVRSTLRAFHRLRWSGSPGLEYVVLGGGHGEAAVVIVRTEDEPWPLGAVPLVSPAVEGRQVFVYHPQVASWLRDQVVRWLVGTRDLLPVVPSSTAALRAEFDALAARGLDSTLGALADGLPRFVATFESDGRIDVAGA